MENTTLQPFIFEGYFSYPKQGSDKVKVAFLIEAQKQNGSFEGIASDTETEFLFEKGFVKIKGFIEDDMISFVKTYPRNYFLNENGEVEASESAKPHAIEYLGNWIAEEEKYVGTFYVRVNERLTDRHKGTYEIEGYEGQWEMKRSEATYVFTWPWLFFPV